MKKNVRSGSRDSRPQRRKSSVRTTTAALRKEIALRKEAETRLRLSEEKFSKAFHLSPDSVNINRLDDGVYLDINEGFTRITGYTREEVIGRSSLPGDLGLWVRKEDRDLLVAGLKDRGEVNDLEAQFRMKNGELRTGLMSARILSLEGIPCVLSVTRDISDRKRAESELRESEERYRHLIETMPDGVYRSTHEGRFLEVNPAMVKILGYDSKEDLMSIHIPSQLYFAASDRESAALEELQEEMAVFRLRRKDGSEVWVEDHGRHVLDEKGNVLYHEGILRDVTERTRSDEALRQNELRMRTIIEGTPYLFFYTQDEEGNITYVSPTVERITGHTVQAWMSRKDWFTTDAPINVVAREATHAHLSGKQSEGPTLVEVRHASGHPILLEVYESPVVRLGRVVGLQGVAHDITTRKAHEEAIVRSLKEKEMLLKEIHHRVKNNLQVVSSLLSMQSAEMPEGPARLALKESQSRVRSMALVHEKLYGTSDFTRVDLLAYSESLANQLARSWHIPGVEISVRGQAVHVGIDSAVPCGLIINELLTNALKHAFVGRDTGRIDVQVGRPEEGVVELKVRDNGVGFPEGKEFYQMVSMGMTLIVNLVDQISGKVTLDRDGGTLFTVRFAG